MMTTENAASSAPKTRIMLVDDSAIVRGFIARILATDNNIEIVASLSNGQQAVESISRHKPDIVILDIEMPVMDGITALPKILAVAPKTKVIMCSTLTTRNAEITMKAFDLGATDCIAKPTTSAELQGTGDFKETLLRLVNSLGSATPALKRAPTPEQPVTQKRPLYGTSEFKLHDDALSYKGKPSAIAIGSSTGGPQALFTVLKNFINFDVPIFITQHMPPTFTAILAQHISKQTGLEAFEGAEGMVVESGKAYVAPGGKHMKIVREGINSIIHLDDGPAENFCKPSVDPMFRSIVQIYGNKTLGVILTGMGQDGLPSCKELVAAGGRLIAQDEASSVVWGMPGAVATNNLCSAVLPLNEIGPWVNKAMMKA